MADAACSRGGALGVLLLCLSLAQAARAELVGEFNARLKNVRTWGAYTAVLDSRIYETDGSPPPTLATARDPLPARSRDPAAFLRQPLLLRSDAPGTDP